MPINSQVTKRTGNAMAFGAYRSIRANSTPTVRLMTLEQRNMTTVHHRPVASIS
ncbi:hypothetical protein D3C72_2092470 [compost metagenome]